jgi:CDP-diacylglycerol--serine O-phosphatidyltransferase
MASRNEATRETNTTVNNYLKLADEYAQKIIRRLPNGLTFANLICGLFSLIMAMNGLYRFSSLFIILAAACDFFDGRIARMLRITSDIGAQLNSLADVVSFGVAPTILAHSIKHWSFFMVIAFISFPYVLLKGKKL